MTKVRIPPPPRPQIDAALRSATIELFAQAIAREIRQELLAEQQQELESARPSEPCDTAQHLSTTTSPRA